MARYKVKVDFPNRPKDDLVVLAGIGAVRNGSTEEFELDEVTAERMANTPGLSVSSVAPKSTKLVDKPAPSLEVD